MHYSFMTWFDVWVCVLFFSHFFVVGSPAVCNSHELEVTWCASPPLNLFHANVVQTNLNAQIGVHWRQTWNEKKTKHKKTQTESTIRQSLCAAVYTLHNFVFKSAIVLMFHCSLAAFGVLIWPCFIVFSVVIAIVQRTVHSGGQRLLEQYREIASSIRRLKAKRSHEKRK